ncbi:hypothetical protein [Hoylesella shahii]|uniref:hypothetical protein n=1 Tax=Hoylesella shahii TaxID=228603 RepID=UPI00248F4184|nr:hypothetical protein [Hoylesella shahii]
MKRTSHDTWEMGKDDAHGRGAGMDGRAFRPYEERRGGSSPRGVAANCRAPGARNGLGEERGVRTHDAGQCR